VKSLKRLVSAGTAEREKGRRGTSVWKKRARYDSTRENSHNKTRRNMVRKSMKRKKKEQRQNRKKEKRRQKGKAISKFWDTSPGEKQPRKKKKNRHQRRFASGHNPFAWWGTEKDIAEFSQKAQIRKSHPRGRLRKGKPTGSPLGVFKTKSAPQKKERVHAIEIFDNGKISVKNQKTLKKKGFAYRDGCWTDEDGKGCNIMGTVKRDKRQGNKKPSKKKKNLCQACKKVFQSETMGGGKVEPKTVFGKGGVGKREYCEGKTIGDVPKDG